MAPLRGWGPRGAAIASDGSLWSLEDHDLLAALRHDRIDARWVVDGPINGELFELYAGRSLPRHSPGDIVVLE